MASAKCQCEPRFKCGHCLSKKKPYFWTTDSGAVIILSDKEACEIALGGKKI